MQVFLNVNGENKAIELFNGQTVAQLKEQIAAQELIGTEMNLIADGELLNDYDVLSNELKEESTIFLNLDLLGGKKKKKKKSYNSPKKTKHKHTTTKLHLLSYFDASGKGDLKLQRR